MNDGSLIPRFGRARRDPRLAVLEGFHPLKHALRFGAEVEIVLTRDRGELAELAQRLAPDLAERITSLAQPVSVDVFDQLAPIAPTTGVVSLARRPQVDVPAALSAPWAAPVVLLENPRDLGNVGACVRVAAGAEAAAVLTSGSHDPWHPDALRGAAGLHFALPVARLESLLMLDDAQQPGSGRPLIALDPAGEPLRPAELDPGSVLVFGTERDGISDALLARAERRLRIPMRDGVSSLNLATSVAAVLFAWRLGAR